MVFVRKFTGGGASYDPRSKTYAEFKCESCGHLDCVDITFNASFNTYKLRRCPKCGVLSEEDKKKNLLKEIDELTKTVEKAQIRIKEIQNELQN